MQRLTAIWHHACSVPFIRQPLSGSLPAPLSTTLSTTLALALLLSGCGAGSGSDTNAGTSINNDPTVSQPISDALQVPDDFDYDMNQSVTLRIQVLDHNGNPGKHIAVTISEAATADNSGQPPPAHAAAGGKAGYQPVSVALANVISRGQTDQFGYFEQQLHLPGHLTRLQVQVSQLGINNQALLDIRHSTVFHEFK